MVEQNFDDQGFCFVLWGCLIHKNSFLLKNVLKTSKILDFYLMHVDR